MSDELEIANRRQFLLSTGVLAVGWEFCCASPGYTQELRPTPVCDDRHGSTLRQTEGPFFKPKSPQRSDLREKNSDGQLFELSGFVLTRQCQPSVGAVVDLWHADEKGEYDNVGFRYRGHVITEANGEFRFRTIMPAVYSGRTRHYHCKVQAPGTRLLTTQLYFPNESANARDSLFRRELLMRVSRVDGNLVGNFNFVL